MAIDIVMAADPKKLIVAIRRGLDDPRYAHAWDDLIGKVGKEIGGNRPSKRAGAKPPGGSP